MEHKQKLITEMTRKERIDELLELNGWSRREDDDAPAIDVFDEIPHVTFDGNLSRRHMQLLESFIVDYEQENKLPKYIPPVERELRELLALSYCGVPYLYTDDGELQDNRYHPMIDFLRDSIEDIKKKMMQRTIKLLSVKDLFPQVGKG